MLEEQLRANEARESRYLAMLEKAVIDTQAKVHCGGRDME